MKYANKNIKFIISPFTSKCEFYYIRFKPQWKTFPLRLLNFLFFYRRLTVSRIREWDDLSQPILYSNFDEAVNFVKRYKKYPELLDEHFKERKESFELMQKREDEYYEDRNKSIEI